MHARVTGDTRRARITIEQLADVRWDAAGRPLTEEGSTATFFSVLLATAMLLDGEVKRGRRLLADAITRTNHEVRDLGRPEHWYRRSYALALALSGDREAAIAALLRYANAGDYPFTDWELYFELDPALETIRQDPRYEELLRKTNRAPGSGTAGAQADARRRVGSRPRRGPFARQLTWPDLTSRRQAGQWQSSTGKLQRRNVDCRSLGLAAPPAGAGRDSRCGELCGDRVAPAADCRCHFRAAGSAEMGR